MDICTLEHPAPEASTADSLGPQGARSELERLFDAVKGARLALPSRIIGEPVIWERAITAHLRQVDLNFGVTTLGLLDEPMNGGLIEDLPNGHRLTGFDNLEQGLTPFLDLGLGRANALYGTKADKLRRS